MKSLREDTGLVEERATRLLDALEGRTVTLLERLAEERRARHRAEAGLAELERRLAEAEAGVLELQEENRELDEQNRELEAHNRHLHERLAGREEAEGNFRPGRRSQGLSALIGRRPPAPVGGDREEPAPGPQAPADESPAASDTRATAAGDEATPATGESAPAASRVAGQGDLAIGGAPSPQALLDEWYQRYGNAFFKGHTRPLMVGIHELLAEREPWPEKLVRRALACYVNLPRYLKAVREGAERIDLEGRPAGRVDAKSAEHARRKLDRLQGDSRPRKARAKQGGKPRSGRQGQEEPGRPQAAAQAPEPPAQSSPATLEEKLTALLAKHNGR